MLRNGKTCNAAALDLRLEYACVDEKRWTMMAGVKRIVLHIMVRQVRFEVGGLVLVERSCVLGDHEGAWPSLQICTAIIEQWLVVREHWVSSRYLVRSR